jgi:AmmeMemoRadiSam system protein B
MLVFSAIAPHPPLLIPSIGRDNLKVIKKTEEAMKKMANDLYGCKPETVVIISPHGEIDENKITINQAVKLNATFKEFGDLSTKLEWPGDAGLAYKIYEQFETSGQVRLSHEENLDHGLAVPLSQLLVNLKETKVLPLTYAFQDLDFHFQFGQQLREILQAANQRIAVIASGDLSHRLTKEAPAGYHPDGKKFDKILVDLLKNKKFAEVLKLDRGLVENAGECGLRSIALLLGIIQDINFTPRLLSYEGPFGVGYLVMEFT